MSNEPVAYIDPYDLERLPHYDCHIGSQQFKNGIPLYTHPVKELTIHEDIVYGLAYKYGIEKGDVLDFSIALLKKASER